MIQWILTDLICIHNLNNLPGHVAVPCLHERMSEYFTELLQIAGCIRSLAYSSLPVR